MLVLNNGAPKSGTTWIQTILRHALKPDYPDKAWQNGNINPSIARERLVDYYLSDEWRGRNVLVKLHESHSEEFGFIADPEVRVIITHRNLPDSVVSWFHHRLRLGKVAAGDKAAWLEGEGRKYSARVIAHRLSWIGQPNTLMMRYEDMLGQTADSIVTLLGFCGMECSPEQAAELAASTRKGPKETEQLNEGHHVRTGGRSVAREELPADYHAQLVALDDLVAAGRYGPVIRKAFLSGADLTADL
jgi:hypothetical protein